MKIENTNTADLELIYGLFEGAIQYQKRKGYSVWNGYDKDAFQKEIEAGNQYKLTVCDEIAIVFSVCYSDRVIWRSKEKGTSLYLHRIAVCHSFRGKKLFREILKWAKQHASEKQLKSIRMDTWADNPSLIEYYENFGFSFVESFRTPNTLDLPKQHRNLDLALLELRLV